MPTWGEILSELKEGGNEHGRDFDGVRRRYLRQLSELTGRSNSTGYGAQTWQKSGATPEAGRWPANVLLDECAAELLDRQTGDLGSAFFAGGGARKNTVYGTDKRPRDAYGYGDSGGASRFFYCAKASRRERNEGCEGMEGVFRGTLSGESKPRNPQDGTQRNGTVCQNHHPTVKPVAVMRWLVRLVARPGDTVLDPFMGSGTTGVACAKEGREFIGIEREDAYMEIARRRIEHADGQLQMAAV